MQQYPRDLMGAWIQANLPGEYGPLGRIRIEATEGGMCQILEWPEELARPTLEELSGGAALFLATFQKIQTRLDGDEFLRTGREVDPRGAVSRARAYAATAMLLGGWHYPSEADLVEGDNPALLAAIYADPTTNTTADSSNAQKQRALHFTLVMLEGQAFGLAYQAELGAYERTASPAFRLAITSDPRDWLELPCGQWATVRQMFLALLA